MLRFYKHPGDPFNQHRVSARRKPIGAVRYVTKSVPVVEEGRLPDGGSYALEQWTYRVGWVAVYDGREVSGVEITRKEAAKYLAGPHGVAVQQRRQNLGDHADKK